MNELSVSFPIGSKDCKMFVDIWNIGIDAYLTAFIKSTYKISERRFYFYFDSSEISILLRRLSEIESEQANFWEDDILYHHYGFEV